MSRPEYIPLSDEAARAVAGPASRHAALIEDAFNVLIETPGGGVSINGDAKSRAGAKQVVAALAAQADSGREVTEADVRVAIGAARVLVGRTRTCDLSLSDSQASKEHIAIELQP